MDTEQASKSISYRVPLIWAIGMFLLLLFLGFFLQSYFNFKSSKDQKIESEIKLKEFFLEVVVDMSSNYSDVSSLESKMEKLWQLPDMDNMVYFRILQPDGIILYSTQAEEISTKLENFQHSKKIEHTDADFLSKKIKVVTIDYPTQDMVAQLGFTIDGVFNSRQALIKFSMSDIVFLFLIIFCFFILFKTVIKPIKKLTNLCDAVRQGQFITKPILSDVEEIHNMTKAFNRMIIDLNNSKIKTEKYGQELEKKVTEKTYELQNKLEEIEKFNKFMVKRELKMIELKENNKKLKKELMNK